MSEDKVVPLFNQQPLPGEPDTAVISWLEAKLAEARKGEIRAIACAVIRPNGAISTGWECGAAELGPMMGSIARLSHHFHVATDRANP